MLGKQTRVVNGQMVNTPDSVAYLPTNYAPVAPSQLWASAGPATVPPAIQAALAAAPTRTAGGNMPPSWTGAPASKAGWLHPTQYPVAMAVLFLIVGLAVLRFVHWRGE